MNPGVCVCVYECICVGLCDVAIQRGMSGYRSDHFLLIQFVRHVRSSQKSTLLRVIPTLAFQVIYSDIYFDILPNILSDIYSDILSGISSSILSGIYFGVLSGIFWHSFSHIFWHSMWHIFWQSIWHIFWHIFWHSIWPLRSSGAH